MAATPRYMGIRDLDMMVSFWFVVVTLRCCCVGCGRSAGDAELCGEMAEVVRFEIATSSR